MDIDEGSETATQLPCATHPPCWAQMMPLCFGEIAEAEVFGWKKGYTWIRIFKAQTKQVAERKGAWNRTALVFVGDGW